jgi:hypothetical protein
MAPEKCHVLPPGVDRNAELGSAESIIAWVTIGADSSMKVVFELYGRGELLQGSQDWRPAGTTGTERRERAEKKPAAKAAFTCIIAHLRSQIEILDMIIDSYGRALKGIRATNRDEDPIKPADPYLLHDLRRFSSNVPYDRTKRIV